MKLADFFARVGPLLEGQAATDEARRALYGDAAGSRDARRLGVYARFCRAHRFEALDGVYVHLAYIVRRHGGDAGWERLVEGYFRAHPMRHVELCENGAAFAPFLDERAREGGLPAWLPELADLEWWEWRTRMALDAPGDAGPGPLRLAATVELRPYRHDLVAWLDDERDPRAAAGPVARPVHVLFWRDPDRDPRRENATPIELWALKAASEGAREPPPGVDPGAWRATLDDLREAGVLVGEP